MILTGARNFSVRIQPHRLKSVLLNYLMGTFFRRRGAERNLFGNGQAVTFERHNFFRVIGQNPQALQSQVDQYLRADAAFMLQKPLPRHIHIQLFARVVQNVRERARNRGNRFDAKTAARVMKIDEHAAIFLDDGFERAFNNFVAIAFRGRENVPGQAVGMHAYQRGRAALHLPRTRAMCCSRSTSEAYTIMRKSPYRVGSAASATRRTYRSLRIR